MAMCLLLLNFIALPEADAEAESIERPLALTIVVFCCGRAVMCRGAGLGRIRAAICDLETKTQYSSDLTSHTYHYMHMVRNILECIHHHSAFIRMRMLFKTFLCLCITIFTFNVLTFKNNLPFNKSMVFIIYTSRVFTILE